MYIYEDDSFTYIPIHQFAVFRGINSIWSMDYINREGIVSIVKEINSKSDKCYIIDFKNIDKIQSRSLSEFNQVLSSENSKIMFCNFKNEVKKELEQECKAYLEFMQFDEVSKFENIAYLKRMNSVYYDNFLEKNYANSFNEAIKVFKEELIVNYIKPNNKSLEYLESSNVYSNQYVNLKILFFNSSLFHLLIYEMCQLLSDFCEKNDIEVTEFKLLGVSNNGAIIAKIMSQLFAMDFFCYKNIGPHYCIEQDDILEKIKRNEKYLMISDFICLGTEYKITKAVINAANAKVIGLIAGIKYVEIFRKHCESDLVNIEDKRNENIVSFLHIKNYGFEYRICGEKKYQENESNER